mgnify:CR=1 FL=1
MKKKDLLIFIINRIYRYYMLKWVQNVCVYIFYLIIQFYTCLIYEIFKRFLQSNSRNCQLVKNLIWFFFSPIKIDFFFSRNVIASRRTQKTHLKRKEKLHVVQLTFVCMYDNLKFIPEEFFFPWKLDSLLLIYRDGDGMKICM